MRGAFLPVAVGVGVVALASSRPKTAAGVPAPIPPGDLRAMVRDTCGDWSVSHLLAEAIVEQESAWNPDARSPVGASDDRRGGAWGLFQITHTTALEEDDRLVRMNLPSIWRSVDPQRRAPALLDPFVNIQLGVAHLAWLNGEVGPSVRAIFVAYNGGVRGKDGPQATRYADQVAARFVRLGGTVS